MYWVPGWHACNLQAVDWFLVCIFYICLALLCLSQYFHHSRLVLARCQSIAYCLIPHPCSKLLGFLPYLRAAICAGTVLQIQLDCPFKHLWCPVPGSAQFPAYNLVYLSFNFSRWFLGSNCYPKLDTIVIWITSSCKAVSYSSVLKFMFL